MKKSFPVDVWSVKDYGLDKWHRECSNWPVSEREFLSLRADIDELYVRTIIELHPEVGDIFVVLYKLTIEYVMFVHSAIVVDRLNKAGLSVGYSNSSMYYEAIVRGNNDIRGIFYFYKTKLWLQTPSFQQRILNKLRVLKQHYKYYGFNWDYYVGLSDKSYWLALGCPSQEIERYAEFHGKQICFTYPFPLTPILHSNSANHVPVVDQVVCQLMSGLEEIAVKYGVQLQAAHIRYLQDMTGACFKEAWNSITEIRQLLRKGERTPILLSALGGVLARCVCIAGRREGYKIIGGNHGNSVGIFNSKSFATIDLSMVDTYVVQTMGAAKLFSKLRDHYTLSAHRQIEVVSVETDKYEQQWRMNQQNPLPYTIESVMLLEYPLTPFRHENVLAFWPYQLDLILRVAMFMRQQGIKTIMKRHPDRLPESEGLYDQYFDELVTEPFETVYEMADAYFFPNITTTTFGFALLTNRPVIFFETMIEDVWEEVHEPLGKRCSIIPSWFDTSGRLMFDEDALAEALRRKPEEPDTEFVEKYMFPEGVKAAQ